MVLTLAIPIRAYYGLEDFITMRHIQNMAKVMLATGLIVLYGYAVEAFMGWYSGEPVRRLHDREPHDRHRTGEHVLVPDLLQRRHAADALVQAGADQHPAALLIALIVNVGMWLERFVIVVTSLSRDFLPSSWGMYAGTMWDWMTYVGTLGLFAWLMFLFLRFVPMISMFEMRTIVPEAARSSEHGAPLRTPWHAPRRSAPNLYGLMAEFDSATALVAAARKAREAGYTKIDAYTPFPIEELDEALKLPREPLPLVVLIGGLHGHRSPATGSSTGRRSSRIR